MKTMRMKWILVPIIILILVPLLLLFVVGLPWFILAISSYTSPDPPVPQNQYGEFPFTLVYEQGGERIEVKDTLVVEYLGVGYNEGMGKYNQWDTYYKSERYGFVNNTDNDDPVLFDGIFEGVGSISLTFELGSPEYYMGLDDGIFYYQNSKIIPGDIVLDSIEETRSISNEELHDRFNIKIIEKTISPPLALYTEET